MAGSVKTQRFILRRTGNSAASGPTLPGHLDALEDVTVIQSTPRMMLVDAPGAVLEGMMKQCADWIIVPETLTPAPDTRVKLRRG